MLFPMVHNINSLATVFLSEGYPQHMLMTTTLMPVITWILLRGIILFYKHANNAANIHTQ